MKASIIIPIQILSKDFYVYFRHLEFCFQAIKQQTIECETVLVDYMSGKSFIKPIKNLVTKYGMVYTRKVRVDKKFKDTFSRGRAINAGIKKTTGDYLFFVDSDCILPSNYIEEHLKKITEKTFTFSPFFDSRRKIRKSGNYMALRKQKNQIVGLRPCSHSHVGILRDCIDKYGGFDDRYVGWGGEDDELLLRLKRRRVKPIRIPTFPIHLWHPTWQELMNKAGRNKDQKDTLVRNRRMYYTYKGQKVKKISTGRKDIKAVHD